MTDLQRYGEFITAVTADESMNTADFIKRVIEMDEAGLNPARLLTGAIGLAAESGEFDEIVKKWLFQQKPLSAENVHHAKRELGDIMWYWMTACLALGFDPHEVIAENIKKLESRYPGGRFSMEHSENRKAGDL